MYVNDDVQGFATSDCRFMLRSQVDGLKIQIQILLLAQTHQQDMVIAQLHK